MPELLRIQTPQFELSIWSSDISKRQETYDHTLASRKQISNQATHTAEPAKIRFSPPIEISAIEFMGQSIDDKIFNSTQNSSVEVLELKDFIFF